MKKALLFIMLLLISSSGLFSLKLPDGTNAVVTDVEEGYEDEVKVLKVKLAYPTVFKTSVGKIELVGEVVFYYNDDKNKGRLIGGKLSKPTRIKTPLGYFLAEAMIGFWPNGSLLYIDLAKDVKIKTSIGDIEIDDIFFHEDGALGFSLSRPQIIDTPVGKIEATSTDFHPNGNLKRVFLSKSQVVNTYLGKLEIDGIWFSENGNLESVFLCKP